MAKEKFTEDLGDYWRAQQLATEGYAVIRLFERAQGEAMYEAFKRSLRELPEYKACRGWRYCKTGFGALGVASSFHNRFVREMRLRAHARVAPIMAEVDKVDYMRAHVKQLLDRMLVRTEDQVPTAESWHQDVSIYKDGDTVYGGWLASTDQTASLIPGTQHTHAPAAGFAKISPIALQGILPRARTVEIPRGCLLIMNQSVVHEVVARRITSDPMCRLFTGWRLTYDDRTLLEAENRQSNSRQDGFGSAQSIDSVIDDMAVPKLPSNQLPAMYNVRNVDDTNQREGLRSWCAGHVQEALLVVTPKYKDGIRLKTPRSLEPGQVWKIPELHAPSISELRQRSRLSPGDFDRPIDWDALLPPYTDLERAILKPHDPLKISTAWLLNATSKLKRKRDQ
eukprot:gene9909-11735_t